LLTGCSDLYIVSEHVELRGDVRVPSGGGCAQALHRRGLLGSGLGSSDNGSSGGNGDLMVSENDEGDRFVVVVNSAGEELAHRSYDRDFLTSHKVDTFQVTTNGGKRFEFSYHGSRECEFPPSHDDPPDAGNATHPG
jgi:hypothetical protein